MDKLAIDLGSISSQICVRSASGLLLEQQPWRTDTLRPFLKSREPSHVVLETSSEAFAVARAAQEAGHTVSVVPSSLAKMLGVGMRGVKTDVRDAQALSLAACQLSELPSVHIPSEQASSLRALNTSRDVLVRSRTQLVNRVRGYLRTELHKPLRCTPKTLPKRMRAKLTAIPAHIEALLAVIDELNSQITGLDGEIKEIADQHPTCRLLMTMPGVGPVTATRFVAAIDTPERFKNSIGVMAYLGLTPGEHSSGKVKHRTGLTKAGPPALRRVLNQAAWSLWRRRPAEPISLWASQIAKRRGRHIAVTALARKMAGILWAMWRDNSPYNPVRAASPVT